MRETGRQIGQPFGYHWIGYYTPEDIEKINSGAADAPAKPDIAVQAGDLKYADLNGDGTINDLINVLLVNRTYLLQHWGGRLEEVGKGLVSVYYSKDRLIIVLLSMEQGLSLVRVSSSHFTKSVGHRNVMKMEKVLSSHV